MVHPHHGEYKCTVHPFRSVVQSFFSSHPFFLSCGIILLTLIAYLPALSGGFVFDDQIYLVTNPNLTGLKGLYRCWTEPTAYAYHPLVMTTFWLEHQLWGLKPVGYHLNNLILHLVVSFLVWRLMVRMDLPGGWIAALFFALHPVHVESVAWITERKDVLSGVFALLTVLGWLSYRKGGGKQSYYLALFCFLLAMLAKSSVCLLPGVLFLISGQPTGGMNVSLSKRLIPIIPFFLVAVIVGGIYWWIEQSVAKPVGREYEFTLFERLVIAGKAIWFYLGKLFLPIDLMPIYPRWEVKDLEWMAILYPLSVILAVGISWYSQTFLGKGLWLAFTGYLLLLFPALGFINYSFMRFSFVADHFQYLASVGPIILVATGVERLKVKLTGIREREDSSRFNLIPWGIGVVSGVLVFQLCGIYQNDLTFWSYNMMKNPEGFYPRDHLALALLNSGKPNEAVRVYQDGLQYRPEDDFLHFHLARALAKAGKNQEAIHHLRETIRINPHFANAHRNLALALASQGKMEGASAGFAEALRLSPHEPNYYNDYGLFLQGLAQPTVTSKTDQGPKGTHYLQEAIAVYRKGTAQAPHFAPLHYNLALALVETEAFEEAYAHFDEALRLSPEEAPRIKPEYAKACNRYGLKLRGEGKLDAALAQFEKGLSIWSRSGELRANLEALKSIQSAPTNTSSGESGNR
jgi:tetratricopeptide (TPR) repeat protein